MLVMMMAMVMVMLVTYIHTYIHTHTYTYTNLLMECQTDRQAYQVSIQAKVYPRDMEVCWGGERERGMQR